MKNITRLAAVALAVTSLASTVGVTVASASTASMDSIGKVGFQASTTTNPIIDPELPTAITPQPPTTPVTVEDGLTIDYASSFDFGLNAISTTNQIYNTLAQQTSTGYVAPFVQVTDNRGTLAGWNLKVSNTPLTDGTSGPGSVLTGSQMTFQKTGLNSSLSATDQALYAPSKSGNFVLNGDGTGTAQQQIMNAAVNQGMGSWSMRFGSSSDIVTSSTNPNTPVNSTNAVSLMVPGSTIKKATNYTSTITWTLENAPSAAANV
ncbi:MAG: WxL domain-containing protein [Streptococcaceae bacterium]|jgi:hypothetical protein|nr:WxL domain-containing protein [Streptococcaceae bacterium]